MKVAIIGGSVGGLLTGIALKKLEHEVEIYERSASEMQGRGAGLVVQPDLMNYMIANGISSQQLFGVPAMQRQILNEEGRSVYRYENNTSFTSWNYLWGQLKDYFPATNYHYNHRLVGINQNAEVVIGTFANDKKFTADLLIGADGYSSVVREHIYPDIQPQYAGYVAFRGLIPEAELTDEEVEFFSNKFTLFPYAHSHLLAYLVPGNHGELDKGNRQLNWVWYLNKTVGELNKVMTDKDGLLRTFSVPSTYLSYDNVLDLQARAEKELPAILSARVLQTEHPFVQAIVDMEVPKMYKDRIIILGDAASVVRPHTASGTAKAYEDAVKLSLSLSQHLHVSEALTHWNNSQMSNAASLIAYGRRLAKGSGLGLY